MQELSGLQASPHPKPQHVPWELSCLCIQPLSPFPCGVAQMLLSAFWGLNGSFWSQRCSFLSLA